LATLAPLTELDAVNEMLGSIGQAPVSSLSGLHGDPALAREHLLSMTRYVQLYGFNFNTDQGYTLTPDDDGVIFVPQGALKIDPTDRTQDLVIRRHPEGQMALWDRPNQTWTMALPVTFDIAWGFPFEDLPEAAKNFITLSASRRFQKRIIGSTELDGFNQEDEARAWSLLLRDERASRDTNVFRQNPELARMVYDRGSLGRVYTPPGGEVTG
jgi:hypothetical protein